MRRELDRQARAAWDDERDHLGGDHDGHDHGVVHIEDATAEEAYAAARNPHGKPSLLSRDVVDTLCRKGTRWAAGSDGKVTITYGFLGEDDLTTDGRWPTLVATEEAAAAIDYALSLIAETVNIDFVRVTGGDGLHLDAAGDANLRFDLFADTNGGRARTTTTWSSKISEATVSIGENGLGTLGSYAFKAALHEISHALGLAHPGEYGHDGRNNYADQADYFEDSAQYTVMSYWDESATGARYGSKNATNLMLHDIMALQAIYGANEDTRGGDTTYGFGSNTRDEGWTLEDDADLFIGAIWDASGHDAIDVSAYAADQTIDLRQGAFSSTGGMVWNLSIAEGVTIEDAVAGSGNDELIGNEVANLLVGGAGSDALLGGGGNDVIYGDGAA